MSELATNSAKSPENLQRRISGLFQHKLSKRRIEDSLKGTSRTADLFQDQSALNESVLFAYDSATDFLNYILDSFPKTEIYLFGGILRDLAMFGRRGFNSDIDVVVEGDWSSVSHYLNSIGASPNKFGGFRLTVHGWDIDLWNAADTWAIRAGLVEYKGISSLLDTTILNWDSILMNWRTRKLIYKSGYFDVIAGRVLDVVLTENPNPLGMLVRVLRHSHHKDAKKLSLRAVRYLAKATNHFTYRDVVLSEKSSYNRNLVSEQGFNFFRDFNEMSDKEIKLRFRASDSSDNLDMFDSVSGQKSIFFESLSPHMKQEHRVR